MHRSDSLRVGPPVDGVTEVDLDGRICLYAPGEDQMLFLNDTASDVWRLANGELTLEELVDLLAVSYGRDPHTIVADVHVAIRELRHAGVLPSAP